MNRRDFAKSLGALMAAPALPFKALMAAPAVAAVPVSPPNLYTWSAAIARTHGKVSTDMLSHMLHVDATEAASLFEKLIRNNVVGPVNALGFGQARAIVPNASGLGGSVASKPEGSLVRDRVRALLDAPPDADAAEDDEAPEQDDTAD